MIKELEQKAITIKTYEKTIRELAQTPASKAQVDRLTETHCVGLYVATAFVAMTGRNMDRFEKPRDIGPWLGLTPKQDRSGIIDRRCHVTKAGSALMRRLLVEIARSCLRAKSIDTDPKAKGLRLNLLGVRHTSCVGQRKAAIAKAILPLTFVLHLVSRPPHSRRATSTKPSVSFSYIPKFRETISGSARSLGQP